MACGPDGPHPCSTSISSLAAIVTAACWGSGGKYVRNSAWPLSHLCSGSKVAPAQGSDPTGPTSLAAVHRSQVIKPRSRGNRCLVEGTLTSKKQERGGRQQIHFSSLPSFHSLSRHRAIVSSRTTKKLAVSYELCFCFLIFRDSLPFPLALPSLRL